MECLPNISEWKNQSYKTRNACKISRSLIERKALPKADDKQNENPNKKTCQATCKSWYPPTHPKFTITRNRHHWTHYVVFKHWHKASNAQPGDSRRLKCVTKHHSLEWLTSFSNNRHTLFSCLLVFNVCIWHSACVWKFAKVSFSSDSVNVHTVMFVCFPAICWMCVIIFSSAFRLAFLFFHFFFLFDHKLSYVPVAISDQHC